MIQNGIQPVTVPGIQDFFGVGGGHGGYFIGAFNARLHKVHQSVVENEIVVFRGDAQHILQQLVAVLALVLNVVNGEYGFNVFIPHSVGIIAAVIQGR